MFRRAFCFCVAFSYLFALSVPAFATSGVDYVVQNADCITGLFDWTLDKLYTAGANVSNWVQHFYDDDICPQNTEAFEGRHEFVAMNTQVDGKRGIFYVCKYCQKAADEIIEPQYDDYVSELPGKQYNSDGAFLWVPGAADFPNGVSVSIRHSYGPVTSPIVLALPAATGVVTGACNTSAAAYVGDFLLCSPGTLTSAWNCGGPGIYPDWKSIRIPVSGIYTRLDGIFASDSGGNRIVDSAYSAGSIVSLGQGLYFARPTSSVRAPWPAFWVEVYTGGSGGNTYDISTRVGGDLSGNLGYVSNGDLVQSQTTTIFDEGNNTYINPVSGDTQYISSWDYDYSDRAYHLTTNEGDAVSVTYGDEHITINEGGTSYTVYYLMEEPEDVQEDTITHTHDWVDSVTTVPTCTASGLRTRTCSVCGWATTEAIPAIGHSFSAPVVTQEPTCTASGIRAGTCTVCGQTTTEAIPALGHDYQAVVTMEPGCVVTGVRTHTCTRCGDSYTTSVPATGHRWAKVSSVPTQYDEVTGELVQQGYTLYRCQNCNEEYRVTSETGGSLLPDAGGGGLSSGTGAENPDLTAMAQEALEASPTVLQLLSGWFTALPASFAGFSGFLKVSFGWMPPEVVTMLSFSVGMICFIGIFRFGFRR